MKSLMFIVLLLPALALAQFPEQALNLHTGPGPELSGDPWQGVVQIGGQGLYLFTADDGVHGRELWRSDGTAAGTWMVMDIHPGAVGSNPSDLTVVGETVCFSADDGSHGIELWCTSGTEADTWRVADIRPGRVGSHPQWLTASHDSLWLYFTADDGEHGRELWRAGHFDLGPAEMTVELVRDINPGPAGSNPAGLMTLLGTTHHSSIAFHAETAEHGRELWRSDGSTGGTVMVRDIRPGPESSIASNARMVRSAGWYYVPANDGTHGLELWRSNFTHDGTSLFWDHHPGSTGSNPRNLLSTNLGLFWWANDGQTGNSQLWCRRTSNSSLLALTNNSNSLGPFYPMVEVPEHGDNGVVYFYGDGSFRFWRSDCSIDGTYHVNPSGPFDQLEGIAYAGNLFFRAYSETHGTELHRINAAGTLQRMTDINPGIAGSRPGSFQVFNNQLMFAANRDGLGRELWRYAGGTASLVANIAEDGGSSRPRIHGILDDRLVLSAYRDDIGREMWVSDGSAAGTELLADAEPGPGSGIRNLDNQHHRAVEHNGHLYYMAYQSGVGEELWRTDGTPAGTGLVINLCTEWSNCSGLGSWNTAPGYMRSVGPWLYFAGNATDSSSGLRLWRSDGTAAGTTAIEPTLHLTGSHTARPSASIGDTLYVQGGDNTFANRELWRVTASGTATLVRDLYPGNQSEPDWLTPIGNTMYFAATDAGFGRELWKTDGTFAGTVRVRDIAAGAASSNPRYLTAHDGVLYFSADAGDGDVELWRSDGSTVGTYRVRDIHAGLHGSHPLGLFSTSSGLYFTAFHPERGVELWISDGTESGTQMLADLDPGPEGGMGSMYPRAGFDLLGWYQSDAQNVPVVGDWLAGVASYERPVELIEVDDGRVVLRGCSRDMGCQLWISNGSPGGTYRLTDMGPAPGGASPGHLTWFDEHVYFAATDEQGFRELWRLALPPANDLIFRNGFQ